MEIHFKNSKIQKICEQSELAVRKLGPDSARKLQLRLAEIKASSSVDDLKLGNPHPLHGDKKGQFALDLARGHRLTFLPENNPVPTLADGGIDWRQVTEVRIEFIGDYHD